MTRSRWDLAPFDSWAEYRDHVHRQGASAAVIEAERERWDAYVMEPDFWGDLEPDYELPAE